MTSIFFVIGKKFMLSLLSSILVLCNRVESSKIKIFRAVLNKIFSFCLTKCVNIFQYVCQEWLTNYSQIY